MRVYWRCIFSKKIDLSFFSLHCDSFELRDHSNLEYSITWYPERDLNPQNSNFESDTYTNSIIGVKFGGINETRTRKLLTLDQ